MIDHDGVDRDDHDVRDRLWLLSWAETKIFFIDIFLFNIRHLVRQLVTKIET